MSSLRRICLALPVITACGWPCLGEDWPEFHGARRDNRSVDTGLLDRWPEGGPVLLWRATGLGEGYSSVAISDGVIYTAGKVGESTFVFALDMQGRQLWRAPNGASWRRDVPRRLKVGYRGSRSTPTVNDGLVYHLGELGRLAAYDAKTGREVWAVNVADRFQAGPPLYGYAESVLVCGVKVIVYAGGPGGYMAALHKKSGRVVWANTTIGDPPSYCSPVLVRLGRPSASPGVGDRPPGRPLHMVVTMTANAVIGVDAGAGELLWRVEHKNKLGNNIATPLYHNGHVYASSGYHTGGLLLKLARQGRRVAATKVWSSKSLDSHHGGVVRVGNLIYGAGHYARGWFGLDFMTGEERYDGKEIEKGSLTYGDGMLHCLGERGTLALVRPCHAQADAQPADSPFEIVSRFKLPKGDRGV